MGPELITIEVNGRNWTGLKEVQIEAGFDLALRKFQIELAPAASLLQTFAPGARIDVLANGDLMCRGFVDRLQPGYRRLRVSGRSTAQDFVDCAALDDNATGGFADRNLLQIAQALGGRFGARFATDQSLATIDAYQLTPGERAFAAVEKLAREQGLTLAGQPDGTIKITKPGALRHAGGLFEGVNILDDAEADLDWAHRHSAIIVRGQGAAGTAAAALQVEATASDASVGRDRPLVHIEDGDLDQPSAQALADARSQREAGESLKASIPVQGFRDAAGLLWTPGYLAWIESPLLGLTQAMLIRRARFRKRRRDGATTRLELVDPRAYGGTAAKGNQSGRGGDIWSVGAPALPLAPASILG